MTKESRIQQEKKFETVALLMTKGISMKREISVDVVFIFTMLFFVAASAMAQNSMTLQDMVGRQVTLPGSPGRIICISPGTLRLVTYLQASDKVVGIEDMEKRFPTTRPYFIANPSYASLPSIGPGGPNTINKEPDYEKILTVQPDVVFISYMERELADRIQNKLGIPVFVVSYGPFGRFDDTVFDSLIAMGKILEREQRAQDVVQFIKSQRQLLQDRVSQIPDIEKPTAYIGGIGFKGTQGLESTETDYAPLEWAGGKNVAKQENKAGHTFINKEKLLKWNPDVIFVDGGGKGQVAQEIEKNPNFFKGLSAFTGSRVYGLYSFNWYMTNLGTVITDAYAVAKILYPGRFEDLVLADKANEVYSFLLGKPLYQELAKINGVLGEPILLDKN